MYRTGDEFTTSALFSTLLQAFCSLGEMIPNTVGILFWDVYFGCLVVYFTFALLFNNLVILFMFPLGLLQV